MVASNPAGHRSTRVSGNDSQGEARFDEKTRPNFPETYEELGIHHIDEEEWAILVSFMERNWYRRVWVLQEFACAHRLAVLCGHQTLPWPPISSVSEMLISTTWADQLLIAPFDSSRSIGTISGIGPCRGPSTPNFFASTTSMNLTDSWPLLGYS